MMNFHYLHVSPYTLNFKIGEVNFELHLDPFIPSQFISSYLLLLLSTKISCLVMRIKQLIIHNKLLSKMNYSKILKTCLQGNYREFSLGEFSNMHATCRVWGLKG